MRETGEQRSVFCMIILFLNCFTVLLAEEWEHEPIKLLYFLLVDLDREKNPKFTNILPTWMRFDIFCQKISVSRIPVSIYTPKFVFDGFLLLTDPEVWKLYIILLGHIKTALFIFLCMIFFTCWNSFTVLLTEHY